MKVWLKVGASVLVVGAVGVAALVVVGEWKATQRAQRKIDLQVAPVAYRTDEAALQRGRYLYASRGCGDCHGAEGGGRTLVDDGKGTRLAGPNITPGSAVIAAYQEVDWVRSIRHGVAPDRRPLRLMPSEDFNRLTDDDLSAVVAWVRQLPPVQGNEKAILELPLPARVMYGFGAIPEAVEKIDHRLPPAQPVAQAPTIEYGRYVAQACRGCHGPDLEGGRIPGAPPDWPAAARLAAGEGSVLPKYADAAALTAMMRSGQRADGSKIAVMPFESLREMNDVDLQALYAFLRSGQPVR